MQLSSLLDSKLITIEYEAKTKDQILADMVDSICNNFRGQTCKNEMLEKVYQREKEGPTVYPSGVAIPHVWLKNMEDTQISVCVLKHPVREGEIEIKLVFLIITNEKSNKLYLNLVSTILKLSNNHNLMSQILAEKTGAGVFNIISNTDIRVQQELTAADIMCPIPVTINQNATLKELGDLMTQHGLDYVPVVDDKGYFRGEINALHYLKLGIPDYLLLIENLDFLRSIQSLNKIKETESKVLVKHLMLPAPAITYPTSSIIKVVFKMIQLNIRKITVIDKKKVVGVVTALDVITQAIRANGVAE